MLPQKTALQPSCGNPDDLVIVWRKCSEPLRVLIRQIKLRIFHDSTTTMSHVIVAAERITQAL